MKYFAMIIAAVMFCLLQGTHTLEIQERIWNGQNASEGMFPYDALIMSWFKNGTTIHCAGSLISDKHVLTAAYCASGMTRILLYLGVVQISDSPHAETYNLLPKHIQVHPNYDAKTFQNDIAILKLPTSAPNNKYISPIKLPKESWADPTTFDNYDVVASGWGKTSDSKYDKGIQETLQYSKIHKMPQTDCVKYYKDVMKVTDSMICTDKQTIKSGPCYGDTGGPLTVIMSNVLYLIGGVSWGSDKCSSNTPVVYFNVAFYLKWISSVTAIPIS